MAWRKSLRAKGDALDTTVFPSLTASLPSVARHEPQEDLLVRISRSCRQGHSVSPSSGPCASAHEVASLCSGDRKYPCGSGGRAWHGTPTISSGLQAGSLTPSTLCPSKLGGGVVGSCSCLHAEPGFSLQSSPSLTLLDFLTAVPKERALSPYLRGDFHPCAGSSSSLSCTPTRLSQ